jgi:hypothetical protein
LIRRAAKRLRQAGHHGQGKDVPDSNRIEVDERGQRKCRRHLDVLRRQQQLPSIAAIGNDPADHREEEDRQLAEERIESEKEGGRGTGDRQDEPVLRHLLHPGPDGGGESAEPENAEIAVGERRSDAAKRGHLFSLACSNLGLFRHPRPIDDASAKRRTQQIDDCGKHGASDVRSIAAYPALVRLRVQHPLERSAIHTIQLVRRAARAFEHGMPDSTARFVPRSVIRMAAGKSMH